jgi:TolB protein
MATATLLAHNLIMPTHQVAFVGSSEARAGVYFMDINRGVFAHSIRTPIIGRQSDFTWSPDFTTIVFRAVQNITIDLYATNLAGDQRRQLTGTGRNNRSPAFSPDGRWLAFTSQRDGNPEIYVMSTACLDTETRCLDTETHRLTNNRFADEQAAWSPDSNHIVFQSNRDGDAEIYTMKADGSDQHRLTFSPSSELAPNWSPDGRLIAFMSDRDINDELYVMNTDGSNLVRLTNTPEYEFTPQWSPDGKQILFQRAVRGGDFETYVMDADGSHVQRLTTVSMFLQNPVWRS